MFRQCEASQFFNYSKIKFINCLFEFAESEESIILIHAILHAIDFPCRYINWLAYRRFRLSSSKDGAFKFKQFFLR